MDQSAYGSLRYGYASPQAYSSSGSISPTPAVSPYVSDETGGSGSVWYSLPQRPHAASFSTASSSSAPYQPPFQRSYSDSGWAQRSVPQSTTEFANGTYYPASTVTYQTSSYYAQPNMINANSSYYAPPTTGYVTAGSAPSLAPIHTNNIPYQNQGFLSPCSAVSPVAATPLRHRRGSEASFSQSSDEVSPEYRGKCKRQHCCNLCDKSFKRKADLSRHVTCVHTKDTAYKYYCDAKVCDRNINGSHGGFTRKDHLIEHLRNFHHRDIPKRLKNRGLENDVSISSQANGSFSNGLQPNDVNAYPDPYYQTPESDTYADAESETPSYNQQGYAEGEG